MPWASSVADIPKRLFDAFLLREPERQVRGRTSVQGEAIARYHAAASLRMQAARTLVDGSEAVAALSLYREAAILFIAAILQAASESEVSLPRTPEDAWQALEEYPPPALRSPTSPELARARELLSRGDPLDADTLSPTDLASVTSAATLTVKWLGSSVEPRTARKIRSYRAARIGAVAVLVVCLIVKLVAGALKAKDLALNKPIVSSSQRFDYAPPSRLVNGDVEQTFGFHSNDEPMPWVRIDLGAQLPLREVRVFNRRDGNPIDNLPLSLQLSDDGVNFSEIARRNELFTQDQPWIVKLTNQSARYLRLQVQRSPGYMALSEIEVY
jgi:hypothetical protein